MPRPAPSAPPFCPDCRRAYVGVSPIDFPRIACTCGAVLEWVGVNGLGPPPALRKTSTTPGAVSPRPEPIVREKVPTQYRKDPSKMSQVSRTIGRSPGVVGSNPAAPTPPNTAPSLGFSPPSPPAEGGSTVPVPEHPALAPLCGRCAERFGLDRVMPPGSIVGVCYRCGDQETRGRGWAPSPELSAARDFRRALDRCTCPHPRSAHPDDGHCTGCACEKFTPHPLQDGTPETIRVVAAPPVEVPGYVIDATGDEGIHSGRARYRVTCQACGEIVHPNTTGPRQMAEMHSPRCVPVVPPSEVTIAPPALCAWPGGCPKPAGNEMVRRLEPESRCARYCEAHCEEVGEIEADVGEPFGVHIFPGEGFHTAQARDASGRVVFVSVGLPTKTAAQWAALSWLRGQMNAAIDAGHGGALEAKIEAVRLEAPEPPAGPVVVEHSAAPDDDPSAALAAYAAWAKEMSAGGIARVAAALEEREGRWEDLADDADVDPETVAAAKELADRDLCRIFAAMKGGAL